MKTIKSKVKYRISRSKDNVFTPNDFVDISGKDQVLRALRQLTIDDKKLIKIGYGLYAKAEYSSIFNKSLPTESLPTLAKEGLEKIGIKTYPSKYETLYNEKKTTQIPTGRVIGVKKRVTRKIFFENWNLVYEQV